MFRPDFFAKLFLTYPKAELFQKILAPSNHPPAALAGSLCGVTTADAGAVGVGRVPRAALGAWAKGGGP